MKRIAKAREKATIVSPLGKRVVAPGLEKMIPKAPGMAAGPIAAAAAPSAPMPVAAPTVNQVAPPPAAVATAAPPIRPKVIVKAGSPVAERLLAEIRDALLRMAQRGREHPSRSVLGDVLG
jgi:hypothetical protein